MLAKTIRYPYVWSYHRVISLADIRADRTYQLQKFHNLVGILFKSRVCKRPVEPAVCVWILSWKCWRLSWFRPATLSRGRGVYLAKFNTGDSAPRSISFWQKRYLFYIPFIKKRYLFHMPTLEHCTPFYALLIKSLNEQYHGRISRITRRNAISASIRNILIKGPLKYLDDRFPNSFIYLNLWNPYPFRYLKPEKKYPFRAEPPRIGHYREYLPPPRAGSTLRCRNLKTQLYFCGSAYLHTIPQHKRSQFAYALPNWRNLTTSALHFSGPPKKNILPKKGAFRSRD